MGVYNIRLFGSTFTGWGPVPITIDRLIRIPIDKLPPPVLSQLKSLGTHEDKVWKIQTKKGYVLLEEDRYLFSWSMSNDGFTIFFSRGLLTAILGTLAHHGLTPEIIDNRTDVPLFSVELKSTETLTNYQLRAVDELSSVEGAILDAGCGSGKTVMGFGLIAKIKQPTLIVVTTRVIMKQWIIGARRFLNLHGQSIGIIGDGKFRVRNITVATHQSLNNLTKDDWIDLNKRFGCILFDESQHSAAPTILGIANKSKAKYRYGVTASVRRKDGRECLIFDAISPRIIKVQDSELEEEGRLVSAAVDFVPYLGKIVTPQLRFRNQHGLEKKDINWGRLYTQISERQDRNELICSNIIRTVGLGHKCLVLSPRAKHCETLFKAVSNQGVTAALLIGKVLGDDRDDIMKRARAGEVDVVFATNNLAAEGLDIPILSCVHIVLPTANFEFLKQAAGRVRRFLDGKLMPLVVDYVDLGMYLLANMGKSREKSYHRLGFTINNPIS